MYMYNITPAEEAMSELYIHTYMYIYMYIYMYVSFPRFNAWLRPAPEEHTDHFLMTLETWNSSVKEWISVFPATLFVLTVWMMALGETAASNAS